MLAEKSILMRFIDNSVAVYFLGPT